MAVTIEDLDFIAPGIAGESPEDKERAIAMAAKFRPSCLSEEMQDEAQLYYAAWILTDRAYQRSLSQSAAGAIATGAKRIKEGDVEIEFATRLPGSSVFDPQGFHARWADLNAICGLGAITVSTWSPDHGCGCPNH